MADDKAIVQCYDHHFDASSTSPLTYLSLHLLLLSKTRCCPNIAIVFVLFMGQLIWICILRVSSQRLLPALYCRTTFRRLSY